MRNESTQATDPFLNALGADDPLFNTLVVRPFVGGFLVYWGCVAFWFLCDLLLDPMKHRIPGAIDWKLYHKSFNTTMWMHLLLIPPILIAMKPLWIRRGVNMDPEELFTLDTLLRFAACPLLSELIFFYTHRAGHIPFLYKHVHSVHHEWVTPCGVSASYAHPLEFVFCFVPTLILPPIAVNLHWMATQAWWCVSLISVIGSHSGYKWGQGSERHAEHHRYNVVKYGPMYILDWLYNTEERASTRRAKKAC
jgi:sterol desaturase/sphingolipid hydroxylase (fatty acid hydroxylase superfamily)